MRRSLLVLALVALVAVAACGDDDSATDAATTTIAEVPPGAGDDAPADGAEPGDDGPGDDDAGSGDEADATTTETTIAADEPAGDPPADEAGDDDGRGDPLVFIAELTGSAEVPGPGDEGATGRAEVESAGAGTLCFDMVASGLAAEVTAAHVHEALAGSSGGVVISIGQPTTTSDATDTWSDVCVDVEASLVQDMAASPERYYVNVHTATHPDGAVRGQLTTGSIFDLELS